VRFAAGGESVDVMIGSDNAATRGFVSMLPLTLRLEEFQGREKIGYLPRELDISGAPGSDPEDGDLIYFVPWGNLGFYTTPRAPATRTTRSTSAPTRPPRSSSHDWRTRT
jgi:hypothetical protein